MFMNGPGICVFNEKAKNNKSVADEEFRGK